jgi:hypothetical protein
MANQAHIDSVLLQISDWRWTRSVLREYFNSLADILSPLCAENIHFYNVLRALHTAYQYHCHPCGKSKHASAAEAPSSSLFVSLLSSPHCTLLSLVWWAVANWISLGVSSTVLQRRSCPFEHVLPSSFFSQACNSQLCCWGGETHREGETREGRARTFFCQRFCLLLHSFVPLIGRPLALASETASTQTKGALNREEIDMEEEGGKREEREREKLFYTSISCPIMLLRADQEGRKR